MNIIDPIIQEFTYEAATTKKYLERTPDTKFDWKPHEKSMSLGMLASHLVDSLSWTGEILEKDEFVMDPSGYQPWITGDKEELLKTWDKNVADAVDAMKGYPNDKLLKTWTFKMGDEIVLQEVRVAILRAFIISHMIHHRGQMSVYLRLNDAPLPSVYGPTADEQ